MSTIINTWIIAYILIIITLFIFYTIGKYNTLTKEELEDFDDIMMNFHQNPDFDDFILVFNNHNRLVKNKGRSVKYWLWGVYIAHPEYYNESRANIIASYMREIERGLRRIKNKPTPDLLDCIWTIYFATGDHQYSDIIRDIAVNCPDLGIAAAANWSYTSIIGTSPLQEEPAAG